MTELANGVAETVRARTVWGAGFGVPIESAYGDSGDYPRGGSNGLGKAGKGGNGESGTSNDAANGSGV